MGDFLPGVCCSSKQEYRRQFRGDRGFQEIRSQKAAPSGSLFPADLRAGGDLLPCVTSLNLAKHPRYLCFQAFAKLDKDKEMNARTCVKKLENLWPQVPDF